MIVSTLLVLFFVLISVVYPVRRFFESPYFKLMLKFVCVRAKITNKIKAKSKIIIGVHVSYIDIMLFHAFFSGSFTAKAEIKKWPLWGWGAIMMQTIFIERAGRKAVENFIKAGKKAIARGMNVILFPEGTTSRTPMKPFKIGVFKLSKETNTGIIPVVTNYDDIERAAWVDDMSFAPHVMGMLGSFKTLRVNMTVLEEISPEYFENEMQLRDFAREAMQRVYDNETLQHKAVTYNEIFKSEDLSQREIVENFIESRGH